MTSTQNIDGKPVRDGYVMAHWSEARRLGVTAVVHGDGEFRAYPETGGQGDIAERAGQVMAETLGIFEDAS